MATGGDTVDVVEVALEETETENPAECPICFELYDRDFRTAKCVPCSHGHVICKTCLLRLFERPANAQECFLNGSSCDVQRPHATCPMCKDVFHLPQNNVDLLMSVPRNEQEMEELMLRRRKLRGQIFKENKQLRHLGQRVVRELIYLKEQMNNHHRNCNIARVSGSAPAVAGGIMFVTGAALAFFTFGASAGLMVAGGVLAGAGGVTAGGASVAELVISSKTKKKIEELIARCQQQHQRLKDLLQELVIQDAIIEVGMDFWFHSSTALAHLGSGVASVIGVVRLCMAAANLADDVAGTAVRVMSTAGRAFHIVGLVAAAVMLPLDIISVVWNAYELATNKPSEFSAKIDQVVEEINKVCIVSPCEVEEMLLKADEDLRREVEVEDEEEVAGPSGLNSSSMMQLCS